jgi:transposase
MTEAEWQVSSPLLAGARRDGQAARVANLIFHALRGGISRRLLPSDFPPW